MKNPKISIVIPSFNQVAFIGQTIESILQQSYTNFEIIIVDGLSTDGTIEVLEKYKHHPAIKNIIIEKDNGQADALRKGFNLCEGQIYAWLNSDDYYEPETFEKVKNIFELYPELDVLNGQLNVVSSNSEKIATWPRRKLTNKQWMHFPQSIGQPSTFFSATIFKKVGGINENYKFAMDYDLFLRFAVNNSKFHFTDEYLANFRVHNNSKTMALPFKFWKEEFRVFYEVSGKKIFSLFYYWKVRGILSTIFREKVLKNRQF